MRHSVRAAVVLAALAGLVISTGASAAPKAPATSPQTYTVMVGWENPYQGIGINAYFPDTVTIHEGDTVHWVQNSNEIHTVTFLAGEDLPALIIPGLNPAISPLMFNPAAVDPCVPSGGLYTGTSFANSGLMGRESGQSREFSLTFTAEGSYDYVCVVHGVMMSGKVVVVDPNVHILSPRQAKAQGLRQIEQNLRKVPAVLRAAEKEIQCPVKNSDGTMTHHVMIGYSDGQIDLMQFFPAKLRVSPGDTVIWEMSASNMAPHTVTFLNGEPEPDLVIPDPQPSGPPLLYGNPAVFFPSQPEPNLTRDGLYNSGVMNPVAGTTYTLVMGDMTPGLQPYICLLHDTSGMKGTLMVVRRLREPPCPPVWRWWEQTPKGW